MKKYNYILPILFSICMYNIFILGIMIFQNSELYYMYLFNFAIQVIEAIILLSFLIRKTSKKFNINYILQLLLLIIIIVIVKNTNNNNY